MLTMVHTNGMRIEGGIVRVDRKFHQGMLAYREAIHAPIVSVHPEAPPNAPIMDAIEVPEAELGYSVLTLAVDAKGSPTPIDRERLRAQLAQSRLMCGGGLGSAALARAVGTPYILFVEYDLRTQIVVTASQVSSKLRRGIRAVRTTLKYAQHDVPDVRGAHEVHCNGYPIHNEIAWFAGKRLLYLDSRMGADMIIDQGALQARLQSMAGRRLRVLFSGRYERLKGADDVIKVAAECARLKLNLDVHTYGQGSLRPEMERLLQAHNLGGRVTIHDAVTFPELVKIARSFDLFICCHIQSDPSCTYLESMGAGLPIVGYANRMWSAMSRVSGAGLASPLGDPASVAANIERLMSDRDLLGAMSHRARDFAIQHSYEAEFALRTDAINAAYNHFAPTQPAPIV